MEPLKPWYLSRTIWASLVVVAATLASALGFTIENADIEALVEAILQTVAAVAAVAAIAGRMVARARIG